ncbi:N-acetylmuramoyl-L-alanine amidase [Desmospora sp. 8437]|nr:N-acetylmuramoyl-L-alanine amidase [Desmospora sp. 8437]
MVAQLLKKHKLPISRVVQHFKWSGKNCPRRLRKSGWSAFLKAVESYMAGKKPDTSTPAKWDGKSFPGRSAFQMGKSHPAVTLMGKRLVAHGFDKHYKVGPGPTFSEADRKNVQDFQKAQGWTGSDADGYPGPETWKRLMATVKGEKK